MIYDPFELQKVLELELRQRGRVRLRHRPIPRMQLLAMGIVGILVFLGMLVLIFGR